VTFRIKPKRQGCLSHRWIDTEGWERWEIEHEPGCPNWGKPCVDNGCFPQNGRATK
jgi:hypothetical protein